MFREGYPDHGDARLAPGLYWARGAQGRLEPDVATALAFAYNFALRASGGAFFPPIVITQGGFNPPTPGEAHDSGGAVDLRARHMTNQERTVLINALVKAGFAVYDLGPPDYGPHIHALLLHSEHLNAAGRKQAQLAPFRPDKKEHA